MTLTKQIAATASFRVIVAISFALFALGFAAIAHADDSSVQVDLQTPHRMMSADDSYTVSLAAGRILKHVERARWAIDRNNPDQAISNVDKGLNLVKIINKIEPQYDMKTDIEAGNLKYSDTDQIGPTYVPIFSELDQTDAIAMMQNVAQKSKKVTEPPEVEDAIHYSAVELNVPFTNRVLLETRRALTNGELDQANAALQTIQDDGIRFVEESIDLPLERAADYLHIAESELKDGHAQAAQNALLDSLDALKEYKQLTGDARSKEVQNLYDEIAANAKSTFGKTEQQTVSKEISGWWSRAMSWFRD